MVKNRLYLENTSFKENQMAAETRPVTVVIKAMAVAFAVECAIDAKLRFSLNSFMLSALSTFTLIIRKTCFTASFAASLAMTFAITRFDLSILEIRSWLFKMIASSRSRRFRCCSQSLYRSWLASGISKSNCPHGMRSAVEMLPYGSCGWPRAKFPLELLQRDLGATRIERIFVAF